MLIGGSCQVSEEVMCASVALHFVLNGDIVLGEGAPQGGGSFVDVFPKKIRCTATGRPTVKSLKL